MQEVLCFYGETHVVQDRAVAASAFNSLTSTFGFPAVATTGRIIKGDTPSELLKNAKAVLNEGGLDDFLIELCASEASRLVESVLLRAAAIRVNEGMVMTNTNIVSVLQDIVWIAANLRISVLVWASTPCTAGCFWRHITKKLGRKTGDAE